MLLRVATGVTGAAVVVGAIWLGAPWLTLLALAGGGLAIREYYRLAPPGVGPMPVALGVAAVAALLLAAEASSGRDFHLASGLALAGVGPLPVALGAIKVSAPLLAVQASSVSDFHIASGLALAAWAFAALLWFIACYREGPAASEDSPFEEEFEANGVPDGSGPLDDEPPIDRLRTSADPDWLGANARTGESVAEREPDDVVLYEDLDEDEFEPDDEPDEDAGWGERPWLGFLFLLLGPVYAGFLLGHGLAIRDLSGYPGDLVRSWLLFTLLVVFACDTGALVVGRLLGRHRMAPRISPNKTWEGAAGGFAVSVGVALLVGLVFDLAVPLWQQALIGAVASVAAQVGDLFESALKRAANVKDSGSIMPGHGGILDRMDSILFALPAVYYMLMAAGLPL